MIRIRGLLFAILYLLASSLANIAAAETDEVAQLTKIQKIEALVKYNQNKQAKPEFIEQESKPSSVVNMLAGLFLTLGVFAIAVKFYTKRCLKSANYPTRHMRVIEKLAVTPKCTLIYFEVQGQRMLATVGAEHASIQQLDFGIREYEECTSDTQRLHA